MGTKKIVLGVLLMVVVLIVSIGVFLFSNYVHYQGVGVRYETTIQAQYEDSQNILSRTSTTVIDQVKVSERYAGDLNEVIRNTMEGRYGDSGSQAVMQWISEQNLNLDSSVYRDISQTIAGGRRDFQNAQSNVIDSVRSYKRSLGTMWSGFWLGMAGFPTVNLEHYQIIIDQSTQERFSTGTDKGFL